MEKSGFSWVGVSGSIRDGRFQIHAMQMPANKFVATSTAHS